METSYAEITEIAYGPNANVYSDVLRVHPSASEEEIQSAFMDRRFELYEALQDASLLASRSVKTKNGGVLTVSERHFIEKKMDALIACFRMLSDPVRRGEYDSTLRMELSPKTLKNSSVYDSPDDVADPIVFADRSNTLNASITERQMPRKGRPTAPTPLMSRQLFPEMDESFVTPAKKSPTNSTRDGGGLAMKSSQSHDSKRQMERGNVLFDSLSNESSLEPAPSFGRTKSRNSDVENDENNFHVRDSGSISVDTRGTTTSTKSKIHSRKVKWSEDVVDNGEEHDQYSVDEEIIGHSPGEGCLGISACESTPSSGNKTAISKYLRSNGYDHQAGVIEAVNDEINGAMADTILAFTQVFSAFTIDDEDIDAFVGTIDSAADDLKYI